MFGILKKIDSLLLHSIIKKTDREGLTISPLDFNGRFVPNIPVLPIYFFKLKVDQYT